jgi:hypothetical protein
MDILKNDSQIVFYNLKNQKYKTFHIQIKIKFI